MMTSEIAATGSVRDQLSVLYVSQLPFSAAKHCCLHFMRSRTDDHSAQLLQGPSPGSIHHLVTASVEENQPKIDAVDMGTKVFSFLGNPREKTYELHGARNTV